MRRIGVLVWEGDKVGELGNVGAVKQRKCQLAISTTRVLRGTRMNTHAGGSSSVSITSYLGGQVDQTVELLSWPSNRPDSNDTHLCFSALRHRLTTVNIQPSPGPGGFSPGFVGALNATLLPSVKGSCAARPTALLRTPPAPITALPPLPPDTPVDAFDSFPMDVWDDPGVTGAGEDRGWEGERAADEGDADGSDLILSRVGIDVGGRGWLVGFGGETARRAMRICNFSWAFSNALQTLPPSVSFDAKNRGRAPTLCRASRRAPPRRAG